VPSSRSPSLSLIELKSSVGAHLVNLLRMLGGDPNGLENGRNPVKTYVLRKGIMYGFLPLIAGLSAGALSWYVAPKCVTVPPGCDDQDSSWCEKQSVFSPTPGCETHVCMKTCGCCAENPKGWCPNKVVTFQKYIAESWSTLVKCLALFVFLNVISCLRFWGDWLAIKWSALLILCAACWVVVFGFVYVVYGLTECRDAPRGISDTLLLVSICCFYFSFVDIVLITLAAAFTIAPYGVLLGIMAAHRTRKDPNILVLDVGEDRARRFLVEEQHRVELIVQTSRSSGLQCLPCFVRVVQWLRILIIFGILLCVHGLSAVLVSRTVKFYLFYVLIFALSGIFSGIRRTQAYRDHQLQKANRQRLQDLQGPQKLIFFYNVPSAMQGIPGVEGQSVISYGNPRALGGEVYFAPTVEAVPGAIARSTHTRILHAEGQTGDLLQIKTVIDRQNPRLLEPDVHVDAVQLIPLEPHHVSQVREWLQERQAMFKFEMEPGGGSVELMQA